MELRIYSSSDGAQMNAAEAQLRAKGLAEGEERVVEVIDNHFQTYRSSPVTTDAIVKLIEATPGLRWLTPAELEYRKVANQEPDRANVLRNWLATHQGKVGQLVNQGDEAFVTLRALLVTLRGYQIDSTTIAHAIDRISKHQTLAYVQAPRRTEPISAAAKADTDYSVGKPFSGSDMIRNPDGSLRSKNFHEQKADRDRAEAVKQPSATSAHAAAVSAAKSKAEQLRGNTHSEDAQIQSIFVTVPGTSEINWPATLDARLTLQKSLNKHRETARFIR